MINNCRSESVESAIFQTLRKFSRAYARKDLDSLLQTFSKSEEVTVISSGEEPVAVGLNALKCQLVHGFAEWDSFNLDLKWGNLTVKESIAWVTTVCQVKTTMSADVKSPTVRFSAILVNEDNEWLIVHIHFSVPCENIH